VARGTARPGGRDAAGTNLLLAGGLGYNVFSGDWLIGRIYERGGFASNVRWEWSVHDIVLTRPPNLRTNGAAASPEEAKTAFQKCWDEWEGVGQLQEAE
jgi:hypothetical protein